MGRATNLYKRIALTCHSTLDITSSAYDGLACIFELLTLRYEQNEIRRSTMAMNSSTTSSTDDSLPPQTGRSHEDFTTSNNLPAGKLDKVENPHNHAQASGERIDPTHPLWGELAPSDSYVDGVYWADLPRAQRTKWALSQSNTEARRELKELGRMIKVDPLSPVAGYFR